ncbi:MAG: activator of HSP90 ATPase 1 family protein [Saprospiraceae bacterium]|nr:activator of HSP90 ATPase 1 family protein [Bacteroidia bacterium]MBT8230234.1 activator of HSP90 ATPase 1 family protein [Bacteroidia bacterium]NNF23004.1 activator of HSP90 ATPase 1 family protein [Saprospiraceae bacterium]NNK90194.1 activator of HSP90 ATPase 1 family protein [Saprospiraceae bacterium]
MDRVRIDMEFIFKASPAIIYQFLTMPECLVRWFCDSVDINDDVYTFDWEGNSEDAELLDDIEEERLRFQWESSEEDEYLEFRMYKSDVTNETILEITDFCDKGEEQEQQDLWESQITDLQKACGG